MEQSNGQSVDQAILTMVQLAERCVTRHPTELGTPRRFTHARIILERHGFAVQKEDVLCGE